MTHVDTAPRTNTLALIAFIAAFVMPLAGLILSVFARRQLDDPRNSETGRGLARWAMVIGVLGTLTHGLFLVFWLTMFFQAVG
ncbi:DUF4190 domain-containing protein [Microbacterium sp. LWO14-1.2]|uniref:DUF4190 domain-containing protein n=1 Tax=Microbacterium sp. LWO14-1.2 TaxID=3135263 RepID=UPI003139E1B2